MIAETTDLRVGAPLHDRLLALLPLVGVWEGAGSGVVPSTGNEFRYGQRIEFAHDGRPFLAYTSRTWLLDEHGELIRMAFREAGFWRPGTGQDDVEVTLADAAGLVEIFEGTAGDARWEIETAGIGRTETAREVDGERRLYAVTGDRLVYASELALPGAALAPHLNAELRRVS